MPAGIKKVIGKTFKVIAWLIGGIVFLLIAVAILIQIPAVQQRLTQKAVAFLEAKIGTDVSLGGIRISFPKTIVLKDLYIEDQTGDTLLYAGLLSINTDMWALNRNTIQLNDIALENTAAFVNRVENDGAFNFTYILEAFAGDSTAVPDTLEQKGWNIVLKDIRLQDIRLRYRDSLAGNHADISLGEFQLGMSAFDLLNNRYAVEELQLQNTAANVTRTKTTPATEPAPDIADSSAALILSMERARLQNVHLAYTQLSDSLSMEADIGSLLIEPEKTDIQNQKIDLKTFSLTKSAFSYHEASTGTTVDKASPRPVKTSTDAPKRWSLSLENLDLEDNSIVYEVAGPRRTDGAIDFNHLQLAQLNIHARDIRYSDERIGIALHNMTFREQSGFSVDSLTANIHIEESEAALSDFLLLTEYSKLRLEATASFPSIKKLGENWTQAKITSRIDDSHINLRDVRYLHPAFSDSLPLTIPGNTNLRIDAAMDGAINNLHIRHVTLGMLSETSLRTSGTIAGLPDPDNLRLNMVIHKLFSSREDLELMLSDMPLPDSIQLPAWINLEAKYAGSLAVADFETSLTSGSGGIDFQGAMNLDSASALRGFNAVADIRNLNVGDILGKPDSVMGTLTMNLELHSNGLSPDEMNGVISGQMDHFDFQSYRYTDLEIDGTVENGVFSLAASMSDKNLDFAFNGGYHYNAEVPRYELTLDVKNADFKALNLSTSPIRGRGTLMVDMESPDFKVLNGNVGIRKVAIFNGDKLYAVDSLLFASIDQEGTSEITINSDLLTANFEGSINIFSLPGVVREYFNSYYALHDSLEIKDAGRQHFRFNIDLKNTAILTELLVPKLTTFVPNKITGEFDSDAQLLDIRMEIEEIQYGNIGLRSFVFSTNSDARELNYNFIIDRILVDSMRIDGLEFNGTVANDSIRTNLIILDSAGTQKYVLDGTFYSREDEFELHLLPRGTVLNYQPWVVPETNYMRFGGEKFVAHNVALTNRREKIIIESSPKTGTPIHIGFRELNLEYLSSMIAMKRPLSGLLDGDILLFQNSTAVTFTSDITINELGVREVSWGDLALKVEQTGADRFDVNFALTGKGNDITVNGFYQGGESPSMDMTARIDRFNLPSLQPLVTTRFQNIKGTLTGEIRAAGTPARPDIDGNVLFKNTEFLSTYLNTGFSINNEAISFIDEGISFDAFEIADHNENKARLNGTIRTRNYRDFSFNLDLFTDRFRLFNTGEGDNELFYGLVEIEANARIRGDMTTPIVDMAIGLSENSHLTYIVPQSEAAILKTEGIVKFVDKTFAGDPFMKKAELEAPDTIKSTFRGIDLTARIELSDQERFTIVIDPLTEDQLTIRGNSTITLNIDPSGDINLTGRYEISEGTYNLSFYKFVKREFNIESGSSITWTGDPLNAQMDIRAIYAVETSPIELFSNQLTGADQTEVNRYRQRLPFLVYLNITGELLRPEIAFQLEMPMDERNAFGGNVYARLQDINTRESDLNKQVFALLILKRFIADNPFENKTGGGFASTARRSVSKILSEQLNRLSENIKGVELSFDIKSYEDYSTGQAEGRTELQLGFSKTLLNDRLVVKLAGNIDIEGPEANQDATDYIGDLALEYKLTPDGRFRITGFRNSNYDMIDGELIETGAGLIYVKDYNSLSELFKANVETGN